MRRRRRSLMRTALAIIATVGLVAGVASWNSSEASDAAWTDSEHASRGITAMTLLPPQITAVSTCTMPLLGVGTLMELRWRPPANSPVPLTPANTEWRLAGQSSTVSPTTTGPNASGEYTTTFTRGLLDGLLGGLLGVDINLEFRTVVAHVGGETWRSPGVTTANVNVPLLGLTPTCSYVNG